MKEISVKFETARLAKEKNFDWSCNNAYDLSGNLGNYYDIVEESPFEENDVDYDSLRYSAPTQSFLQKWLREVHNIHIHICYFTESNTWNVDLYKLPNNDLINNPMEFSKNNTYEQALEVGIYEGLKLVKLC